MSSPFMLSDSPPPSPWLPLPPAEGFAAPENFGDWQIFLDEMPCIPFGDVQISPLAAMPCIPAAVAEETNYAAAPAPLVDTHGTGTGQLSSNFSLSSTTSNEFDEEEVQQKMMSLQHFLHEPIAPDGLSNTANGGPAARSHADAVPVVQQGTSTTADELPHPQQRLPLPTNDPDPEAQPGGGWAWPDLSLADKEVQIQPMRPTISASQPPSPTPVINAGPDEANQHAASAPMGSQETLMPAAPQDQEAEALFPCIEINISRLFSAGTMFLHHKRVFHLDFSAKRTGPNILSRASTRRRANKSRGLPSRLQVQSKARGGRAGSDFRADSRGARVEAGEKQSRQQTSRADKQGAEWRRGTYQAEEPDGGAVKRRCRGGRPGGRARQAPRQGRTAKRRSSCRLRTAGGLETADGRRTGDCGRGRRRQSRRRCGRRQRQWQAATCDARLPPRQGRTAGGLEQRSSQAELEDVSGNLYRMGIDMIQQLGRRIGKMMKDEQHRSSIVWQHFWRTSPCKYCRTVTVICPYCHTVMRDPSTIKMLRHLESIHQLPASSGARSSQSLQIKEIAENANGEREPIETDNSNNCATAARVDTQGTNAVVLSPWQQHQPLMDREEQMATILSSQPCCPGPGGFVVRTKWPDSWCDLIIRLSDSSYCSSTTKSPHDGFRLKFYDNSKEKGYTISAQQRVQVRSSAAWMHVSENPYEDHPGVSLATGSHTIGSSYLLVGTSNWDSASAPAGCAYPWHSMRRVLCSLGFKKEFATKLVMYAFGRIDECNLRLRSPSSSNMGKSIVKQAGDVPSGKRKRKPLPPRSKVWNHFTKEEVVEAEGSTVTMARCNHCGSKLKADSASHGTTQLKRHITSTHPDELAKSPL
ncbi:uncharacterized protein [Miscanthus floridulus]|uniref:uncharacterized protein isoform X2 n=1 Tax=Miscanthus floridulus TaxID=154761 RepID=UPI003457DC1B